jgi:hypothetical protein
MNPKVLLKYEKTDIDSRTGVVIEPRLTRLFGVKLKLKTIGDPAAAKVDAKTPALWIAVFQSDKLVVQLRIGNETRVLGEFDVGSVADAERRRQIVDAIRGEGIIDPAEAAQFQRRHPDKARLAELHRAMVAKLKAIEALKNELLALKTQLAASGG